MKTLDRVLKDGGIIRKFGNWWIELDLDSGLLYIVGDTWTKNYQLGLTVYGMGGYTWACDNPDILPQSIQDYLWDNYEAIGKIQNQYLEIKGV